MKRLTLLTALPLLCIGCEAATTTPPGGRDVTPTEVSALTARAAGELLPAVTEALHALDDAAFFADLGVDFTELPAPSEVTDAVRQVTDVLFAEAAVETRAPAEITYRARPQDLCDGETSCVRMLTTHPIRFVVTSPTVDHLHIAVDVGARRLRALQLDLAPDRIAADVELAQLRLVALELAADLDVDPSSVPADVGGLVHLEASGRSVAMSTAGAVHVAGSADGAPYRFALGNSQADFDFDVAQDTVVGSLALGAMNVDFPFAWIGSRTECSPTTGNCVSTEANGQLQYAAAGLRTSAHFDAVTDTLVLDDLGFGSAPVTVSLDGVRQVSFDMNAVSGRTLDISARYLRQELELAVSPQVEAVLELSMAAIAREVEVAAWAIDESIRLRFDGATSPTLRIAPETGIARVVSGSFVLSSDTTTLSAGADECIGLREDAAEDTQFVDAFMSFPCE